MNPMAISMTALDVEWRRLEVISQNIANANTTRTASGQPYRPVHLLSGPRASFADRLEAAGTAQDLAGVMVYGLEEDARAPRRVHEPTHPDADAEGFVAYPDIDNAAEMVLLVKTARAYEANLVALNTARRMHAAALDLGRRG